mmetsp:Transcript_44787/g.91412  ORF Transcript_44787/g.91412 Transcript_44787/m.91412 type:complete len:363 (-) Transcript_44787:6282-7370(-)
MVLAGLSGGDGEPVNGGRLFFVAAAFFLEPCHLLVMQVRERDVDAREVLLRLGAHRAAFARACARGGCRVSAGRCAGRAKHNVRRDRHLLRPILLLQLATGLVVLFLAIALVEVRPRRLLLLHHNHRLLLLARTHHLRALGIASAPLVHLGTAELHALELFLAARRRPCHLVELLSNRMLVLPENGRVDLGEPVAEEHIDDTRFHALRHHLPDVWVVDLLVLLVVVVGVVVLAVGRRRSGRRGAQCVSRACKHKLGRRPNLLRGLRRVFERNVALERRALRTLHDLEHLQHLLPALRAFRKVRQSLLQHFPPLCRTPILLLPLAPALFLLLARVPARCRRVVVRLVRLHRRPERIRAALLRR